MVTLIEGQESRKKVHGGFIKLTPYTGTDWSSEQYKDAILEFGERLSSRYVDMSSMGIGLACRHCGLGYFHGFVTPHDIIGSYRAMKILEVVPEYNFYTLSSCMCIGRRDNFPSDRKDIEKIERMIGSNKLTEILTAPIPSLDDVVRKMKDLRIRFDVRPISEAISEGKLQMTSLLEEVIQDFNKGQQPVIPSSN